MKLRLNLSIFIGIALGMISCEREANFHQSEQITNQEYYNYQETETFNIEGRTIEVPLSATQKDRYIIGGDLLMTRAQVIKYYSKNTKGFLKYKPWPEGKVYYQWAPSISSRVKSLTTQAINHISSKVPKITFIESKGNGDYLKISDNHIYSSGGEVEIIGYEQRMGEKNVRIGKSADLVTIIHELGHSLGLLHEFTRPDRDKYILFHPDNGPFYTQPIDGSGRLEGTFDYESIMNYSSVRVHDTAPYYTIVRKDNMMPIIVGNSLSSGDISALNSLYK
ncbi:hypothetical protein HN014_01170 [Aquimarina sp. TRL1]|uniref:M12 family metallopeptidase n=1 Tax=Aquimarina sp. (strain TRL1) TaxID=2736252 RepID=UPI00158C0305|nr:M12 family metallopeptidase [Aquimarina sp. TRL1]QKX03579.1 hypothetical protein HN014_01170 [Aquimarina sp. TRL1]